MILHNFAAISKCLNMKSWTKTTILLLSLLLTGTVSMAEVSKRFFRKYSAADGLADNSAHTLSCTLTGRMVITTMGQINFYDGQRFSYINAAEENLYPLANYSGNYHQYFDKYHHLWLKNKHNVTCVNLTTETFVNSIKDEFSKFGMDKPVQDIFVDGYHIVWLLTEDGLYNVESKKILKIRRDLNLQDLEVYDKKQLMLFYENGLLEIFDLTTEKKVYEGCAYGANDVPRYDRTSVLLQNKDVFYQIRNGAKEAVLNQFDITKKEWKEILRTPYHLNNLAMKDQADSLVFIPCEYGYWAYETWKNNCRHYETMIMEDGQSFSTNLNVMCFDHQGGMWVGTERRGLLYSRPYQAPFTAYTWDDHEASVYSRYVEDLPQSANFRGKDVNCVFQDSRGWTWVGTGQGLQLYRKKTDVLPQVITKRDGLLNNVIHSVVEDQLHNIWVATSFGISCLLFEDDRVHYVNSYDSYDKVPNESFINGKAALLHDGTIVMQSLDHVIVFNPNNMKTLENHYDFKLYPKLVRLMVKGVAVRTGEELDGNVILDKALTRTKELNLNYDQNSISLTFSALNFFRPAQTCYRVRVKGLDEDWRVYTFQNSGGQVDSRGLLHLPLMSLRPGTYQIELQTSMLPDEWDTEPYVWTVNVLEPWWRTTGMFFALFGVLLALVGVNIYYYLKNANLRAMRNSGEVGLIRRIRNFAERGNNLSGELLEPSYEEITGTANQQNDLSPEFINVMVKIMPRLLSAKQSELSMHELSDLAGMKTQDFYSLVNANIYKSPRTMARMMMLKRAENLLATSNKSIDMIADECSFVSPNFFIALFFHTYKMTPLEYRKKNNKKAI